MATWPAGGPAARIGAGVDAAATPYLDRFSGFADLYDANRPTAPARLGPLLARYAGVERPVVVDLGSGTGLSSRWAAGWADQVIGIEPNDDMRAVAVAQRHARREYRAGVSHATGLADDSADVVVAVQAMHWMEPTSTHAEVARILRPGGVFAIVDADWPPVSGVVAAEVAWIDVHQRVRVLEARLARGLDGAALAGPDRRRRSRARRRRRPRRPAPQPRDARPHPLVVEARSPSAGCRPAGTTPTPARC